MLLSFEENNIPNYPYLPDVSVDSIIISCYDRGTRQPQPGNITIMIISIPPIMLYGYYWFAHSNWQSKHQKLHLSSERQRTLSEVIVDVLEESMVLLMPTYP